MAGMIFMVTVPTECEEMKLKTKSHDVPNVVITNEHQMPRSDPKCAAVESGSVGSVRQIYFDEKKNKYFYFIFFPLHRFILRR